MEPMYGTSDPGEDLVGEVTPPLVAHESSALVQTPAETLAPVGIPVELRERRAGVRTVFRVSLFGALESHVPGWMSRHSSRARWESARNEPYVDLSPLDLTRRH